MAERAVPDLVVVGGVPGAGKSTAIELVLCDSAHPDLRALDSDQVRRWLAARVSGRLAYRWYRPLVHGVHLLRVSAWLATGPRRSSGPLVVHDPCTRPARLRRLARWARRQGWTPALLLVDATRAQALAGQLSRGRVIDPDDFDRHWRRWLTIRSRHRQLPGWKSVDLVTRADAAASLSALLAGRPAAGAGENAPVRDPSSDPELASV